MKNSLHGLLLSMRKIEKLPFGRDGIELITGGLSLNRLFWRNHQSYESDPYWRIYLPVSGELRLYFAKEEFSILPGNLYLIPPEQNFRMEGIKPFSHYWLHFISPSLTLQPNLQRPVSIPDPAQEYRKLMHRFFKLVLHAGGFRELAELYQIPVTLIAALLDGQTIHAQQMTWSAMEFSKLKDFIEENLSQDLRSKNLAVLTGLSLQVFTSRFRKETGLPPKQYISLRRINRAKQLLLTTDEPIKNIAGLVGFSSLDLFYRLFLKYAMGTPADFRKMNTLKNH